MVWQRALTNTIGGTVYSFSILLAAFMAGLAIGGHYSGKHLVNQKDHVRIFGYIQLATGLFGLVTYFLINNLQPIYAHFFYLLRGNFALFNVGQMVMVFAVMIIPTTLMGAGFPVIMEAWSLKVKTVSRTAGDVYSVNTWGAAFGSLLAGFVLVPLIGLRMTNLTAALINFVIAAAAFVISDSRRQTAGVAVVLTLALPLALAPGQPGVSFGFALADHYQSFEDFKSATKSYKKLFDKEGAGGRVRVWQSQSTSSSGPVRFIVNGGRFEGSTGNDIISMKLLAGLPLAVHRRPKSFLNIGLGTGLTLATAAKDKRLRKIDNVEIDPVIYEAVEKHFYPRLLSDKRVGLVTDDGRHYIAYTKNKYDIIVSQPSYPTRKSSSHLFTQEFYQAAAGKLKKDGIFVQWLPRYLLAPEELGGAVKTFISVFPNTYAWELKNIDVFLVGLKSDRVIDGQLVDEMTEGLDESSWKWKFAAGPADLAAVTADPSMALNTDDLPYIEFSAARNKLTGLNRLD